MWVELLIADLEHEHRCPNVSRCSNVSRCPNKVSHEQFQEHMLLSSRDVQTGDSTTLEASFAEGHLWGLWQQHHHSCLLHGR